MLLVSIAVCTLVSCDSPLFRPATTGTTAPPKTYVPSAQTTDAPITDDPTSPQTEPPHTEQPDATTESGDTDEQRFVIVTPVTKPVVGDITEDAPSGTETSDPSGTSKLRTVLDYFGKSVNYSHLTCYTKTSDTTYAIVIFKNNESGTAADKYVYSYYDYESDFNAARQYVDASLATPHLRLILVEQSVDAPVTTPENNGYILLAGLKVYG